MTMNVKRLLWESKLAVALSLLIMARCVDRVLYTYVAHCVHTTYSMEEEVLLTVTYLADELRTTTLTSSGILRT